MDKNLHGRASLGRRAFLVGTAAPVGTALLAACGVSPGAQTATARSQPSDAGSGATGYLHQELTASGMIAAILFIQWTEVNDQLSGRVLTARSNFTQVVTDSTAFTGLRSGSSITLNAGRSSDTGTLQGDFLTIRVQDRGSGQLTTVVYKKASEGEYADALANLRKQANNFVANNNATVGATQTAQTSALPSRLKIGVAQGPTPVVYARSVAGGGEQALYATVKLTVTNTDQIIHDLWFEGSFTAPGGLMVTGKGSKRSHNFALTINDGKTVSQDYQFFFDAGLNPTDQGKTVTPIEVTAYNWDFDDVGEKIVTVKAGG